MGVWAIEPSLWEARGQPAKQGLVAGVHAQCDVRLLAISAKVALTQEYPNQQASLEVAWGRLISCAH